MRLLIVALAVATGSSACAPCQSECERLYGDGEGQCDMNVPDYEGDEGASRLIYDCTEACRSAMSIYSGGAFGEVGDYDPHATDEYNVLLETAPQVELWRDCVNAATCDEITSGDCQPHY